MSQASPIPESGAALVKSWLDALEDILRSQAELAGLLGHSTSIGDAREFFVKEVLSTILPRAIHVGRGIVFSASHRSRQVDVVLYDSRYPLLEVTAGFGLYHIEGVVATIEVKSRLTGKTLTESLNNCLSVMDVSPHLAEEQLNRAAEEFMKSRACSLEQAVVSVCEALTTPTFIFAFRSGLTFKSIAQHVDEWVTTMSNTRSGFSHDVKLPLCIAAEFCVGLKNDGWLRLEPSEQDARALLEQCGDGFRLLMGTWRVDRHFAWLIMRLLDTICRRFKYTNESIIGPGAGIISIWRSTLTCRRTFTGRLTCPTK